MIKDRDSLVVIHVLQEVTKVFGITLPRATTKHAKSYSDHKADKFHNYELA